MAKEENKASENEEVVAGKLCFKVWIVDLSKDEALVVGRTYLLRASLTPPANDQTQYAVDHVDVIVICPHFEKNSLRESLPIPPKSDIVAEFRLVPTVPGEFIISVFLLVKNEIIHESKTAFKVR
jgi:hypothetical protein